MAKDGHCDVSGAGHQYILETGDVNKKVRGEGKTMAETLIQNTNQANQSDYSVMKKPKSVIDMNANLRKFTQMLDKKRRETFFGGEGDLAIVRSISTKKGDTIVVLVLLVLLFLFLVKRF